jgi:hypothetical protein
VTENERDRDALLARFDAASGGARSSARGISDEDFVTTMPSGWTPKEMLGHLAFWLECTKPVVDGMLRGNAAAMAGWRFGSGYVADDTQPWPEDTIHNRREADWARQQQREAILARLDAATTLARSVIESLSEDESVDPSFVDYVTGSIEHVEEHSRELT